MKVQRTQFNNILLGGNVKQKVHLADEIGSLFKIIDSFLQHALSELKKID